MRLDGLLKALTRIEYKINNTIYFLFWFLVYSQVNIQSWSKRHSYCKAITIHKLLWLIWKIQNIFPDSFPLLYCYKLCSRLAGMLEFTVQGRYLEIVQDWFQTVKKSSFIQYIYGPICYFSIFLYLSRTKSILLWIVHRIKF